MMIKMENLHNCFYCGDELIHSNRNLQTCLYCQNKFEAEEVCPSAHYVCDLCRAKPVRDLIFDYCLAFPEPNPVEMAVKLMKWPGFKMHCPDHHFLVPAALLSSYARVVKKKRKLRGWLEVAKNRAEKVPGAFCGTHGSCGAAVGTGIFISTITGATPLKTTEWSLCNSMVGKSLLSMAVYGGPRCCKRVTFLALLEAGRFVDERLSVRLNLPDKISCSFYQRNEQECLKEKCPFYPLM